MKKRTALKYALEFKGETIKSFAASLDVSERFIWMVCEGMGRSRRVERAINLAIIESGPNVRRSLAKQERLAQAA